MGNERNEIKQIAEYDLKVNFIQHAKAYRKAADRYGMLLDQLKLVQDIGSHTEWGEKYLENTYRDLDNCSGTFPPMGIIYEVLWGWGCIEGNDEFRNFKVTPLFNKVLFGGDWVYTLKSVKDSVKEESYKVRGCIGTFTLVPAYFNVCGHGNKCWEEAVHILEEKDWEIKEIARFRFRYAGNGFDEGKFSPSFKKENYCKYINTMFLWDFDKKCSSDEIRNQRIRRRSYFMAAMLKIAIGFMSVKRRNKWEEWEVSDIYKYIVQNVFLDDKEIYSNYNAVFDKIDVVIKKAEEEGVIKKENSEEIKNICSEAKELIYSTCSKN